MSSVSTLNTSLVSKKTLQLSVKNLYWLPILASDVFFFSCIKQVWLLGVAKASLLLPWTNFSQRSGMFQQLSVQNQ